MEGIHMPTAHSRRVRRALAAAALLAAVAIPAERAAAARVSSGGFSTNATVAPNPVGAGSAVTITAGVTATTGRSGLVDVEVYDQAGHKLAQRYWDGQSFPAGTTRGFQLTWAVPAGQPAGTYRVDIGVFSTGWGALYHWNSGATTVSVTAAAPATTTTTVPRTTTTTISPTTTSTVPRTTT